MALYLKNGSLLLKGGMLTTSQPCCCVGGACCLPERCVLSFIASFPGVSASAPEIAGYAGEVLNTSEGSTVCAYRKVLQVGQEQCSLSSQEVIAETAQIDAAVEALGGVSAVYNPTWLAASCEDGLTQASCEQQGGTYHAGKTCAQNPCVNSCCLPDGTCVENLTQSECESCGEGCPPVDGCRLIVARVYDGFEIEDFNELLANETPCGQCEFCFYVEDVDYEEGGQYSGSVTVGYGANCEPVIVSTSVSHTEPEGENVTWPTLSIRLEGCTGAGERGTYHAGKPCAISLCNCTNDCLSHCTIGNPLGDNFITDTFQDHVRLSGIPVVAPFLGPEFWKAGYPAALSNCTLVWVGQDVAQTQDSQFAIPCGGSSTIKQYRWWTKYRLFVVDCQSQQLREVSAEALVDVPYHGTSFGSNGYCPGQQPPLTDPTAPWLDYTPQLICQ